ncbi:MAG TPA: mechanosensitive ion channel [Chitinophagales bacterium]|nr:mechanosensitive ion channel [Chitinophagales bacterium]HRK29003.1 mechanosensitive ion channel [Chitinophagales bacterium]
MNSTVETITNFFATFADSIARALPNVIGALGLLLIGYILAKILSGIIYRLLIALKADNLSSKLQEIDLLRSFNLQISRVSKKVVYWIVLLIFITAASELLGLQSVSEGIAAFLGYLPRLFSALIFFIAGVFIANIIKEVLTAAAESLNINGSRLIGGFVFYFFVIIIAISSLNQAGIDTAIIAQNITIVIGGIVIAFAIGYGFAAKDIMANLLASFYSRDKFSIGQRIKVDNVEGTIIKLDSTSVTLDAGDRHIILPLQRLLNTTVEILS